MFGETAVLKVLENPQKKVSSSVPRQQFELHIPFMITTLKTASTANV